MTSTDVMLPQPAASTFEPWSLPVNSIFYLLLILLQLSHVMCHTSHMCHMGSSLSVIHNTVLRSNRHTTLQRKSENSVTLLYLLNGLSRSLQCLWGISVLFYCKARHATNSTNSYVESSVGWIIFKLRMSLTNFWLNPCQSVSPKKIFPVT